MLTTAIIIGVLGVRSTYIYRCNHTYYKMAHCPLYVRTYNRYAISYRFLKYVINAGIYGRTCGYATSQTKYAIYLCTLQNLEDSKRLEISVCLNMKYWHL